MQKLSKFGESLRNFDFRSIANDKVIICMAFLGLVSTVKFLWPPLTNTLSYLFSNNNY